MTLGHLIETVLGKLCATNGTFGDCTAFGTQGSNISTMKKYLQETSVSDVGGGGGGEMDKYAKELHKVGFHSSGTQVLYNGMTGEQITSDIFIGTNYYMRLKHMVKDKINYRASGPKNILTRQSVHGRANDGGLRLGEMERDSVITHGMSEFLRESFMERGDQYKMAVCNITGLVSIYNPRSGKMISPSVDGPLTFVKDVNSDDLNMNTIVKFGRSFSIVDIPYSFKLLIQEIQVLGVQMRLVTDENIHKISNMMSTQNIIHLTKNSEIYRDLQKHKTSINKYITEYTKRL
jgi:DNA-directed RNA polymerase II subunit RPB2